MRRGGKLRLGKILEGAKAGALNGLPWGAISGVVFLVHASVLNPFPYLLLTPEEQGMNYLLQLVGFAVMFTAGGGIFGAVLGAIFGKVRDKLPSRSSFMKCVVLYSVLWVVCQAIFIQSYWRIIVSFVQYPRTQVAVWMLEFPVLSFLIAIGAGFTFNRLFVPKT